MQVAKGRIRTASARAGAAADDVPVTQVPTATSAGAHAVPASQLAAALGEVGPELGRTLREFAEDCSRWAATVDACLADYDETDFATQGRLDRMSWRAV